MPADADDLAFLMRALPEEIPVTVIGLGSNLLVRDGGVDGVVVRLSARGFGKMRGRGKPHPRRRGARRQARSPRTPTRPGIGGFAFYHGIPGGIGGALRMNAGANGVETSRARRRGRGDRPARRAPRAVQRRHGLLLSPRRRARRFHLRRGDLRGRRSRTARRSARTMDAVQEHREKAQPVKSRTGGSTFKNPIRPARRRAQRLAARSTPPAAAASRSATRRSPRCTAIFSSTPARRPATTWSCWARRCARACWKNSGVRLEWEIKRIGKFGESGVVEPFLGRA